MSGHQGSGSTASSPNKDGRRIRNAWFPRYPEVRHLLRIWPGRSAGQVTGLQRQFVELRGTPQNQADWKDPDSWIDQRLKGTNRELAETVWHESQKTVNPRWTDGSWKLCRQHDLLVVGANGLLALTDRGKDFLEVEGGNAESFVDRQEGVLHILALVSDIGPASPKELLDPWTEYLKRYSGFRSPSTRRGSLQYRLANLLDRAFVRKEKASYSTTASGDTYLRKRRPAEGALERVETRIEKHNASVRAELREFLHDMAPLAFEHLIKHLLEEMDYSDVKVTPSSADGGVDVVAEIQLGITSVREVVQAKRHRSAIQRKDLDALRGSLHRFNAVRGTIITTSRFTRGTEDAAFEAGAAPITLIDGDRLLELLVEHEIGVQRAQMKQPLTVDREWLDEFERTIEVPPDS